MITEIFNWISKALDSSPAIALLASFLWGILSVILSPCHLGSIPLIIGFINGQGKISTKRAFSLSFLFSLGILVTIGIIGLITGLLGKMLGYIPFSNYFLAIIFFVIGFYLLGVFRIPFLENANRPAFKRRGLFAAIILGLIFGIALGPCTFAYMAPVLAMVFKEASTNIIFAVSLMFSYAIGHCSVIVLAGTFTEVVQNYLNWNEKSKGAVIVKRMCGALVILGGIYLLFA